MLDTIPTPNSSWVDSISYDADNSVFVINTKKGQRIAYMGVPEEVWTDAKQLAGSIGSFLHAQIIGKFTRI